MDGIFFLLDQAGRTIMALQAELEQEKAKGAALSEMLDHARSPRGDGPPEAQG